MYIYKCMCMYKGGHTSHRSSGAGGSRQILISASDSSSTEWLRFCLLNGRSHEPLKNAATPGTK